MAAETKKRYLKVNDWILGDVIGQGNDAVVRAAVNQSTNVKVILAKRVTLSPLATACIISDFDCLRSLEINLDFP